MGKPSILHAITRHHKSDYGTLCDDPSYLRMEGLYMLENPWT